MRTAEALLRRPGERVLQTRRCVVPTCTSYAWRAVVENTGWGYAVGSSLLLSRVKAGAFSR